MQKNGGNFYQFQSRQAGPGAGYQATEFDGKRLRKAIARKTVDYNTSIVRALESRLYIKDFQDRRAFQPDIAYYTKLLPPSALLDNPMNSVTTKFVRTSTNKMRCPIFCVLWTPEGRRLVSGASSGEFTLWNGLMFNFETILQAHDTAVRVMVWSHNENWMVTGDHSGYVKYWQSNMNNVKMFQAHKEPVRAVSFCPTDSKLASCSDDGTIRIWDFLTCYEERILRGHGADVKCLHWHPTKSLVVSGSKDNQQPIKLWDPRTGGSLATLHAHKNTVMDVKWNQNGNWLLTSSRDHLIKIFDVRNLSQEMQVFRGHKKEACCLAWHPVHEGMFASGGSDGSILFWEVGTEKEIGSMEQAHESVVWSLDWHPLGHILASGSNDHTCKFWTRNRPGDKMRDKYNLNLMPKGAEEADNEEAAAAEYEDYEDGAPPAIPGLGLTGEESNGLNQQSRAPSPIAIQQHHNQYPRKVPFSKPVPKQFENLWTESKTSPVPMQNESITRNDHQDNRIQGFPTENAPVSMPNTAMPPPPFSMNGLPPPSHPPPPIPSQIPPHISQMLAMHFSTVDPVIIAQVRAHPMLTMMQPHEIQMLIQQLQQQSQSAQSQQPPPQPQGAPVAIPPQFQGPPPPMRPDFVAAAAAAAAAGFPPIRPPPQMFAPPPFSHQPQFAMPSNFPHPTKDTRFRQDFQNGGGRPRFRGDSANYKKRRNN